MFPAQFDYHRASSVEDALEMLEDHGDDGRVLAGGHSLLTEVKNGRSSPPAVVDISEIDELRGIDVGSEATTVGALTTYADVVDSESVWKNAPAFAEATKHVGDIQIRNRGTVGGNLAQADPEGDLPASVIASDATILVRGTDGERAIDATEFVEGPQETTLERGELVTSIRIPHSAGGAYVKKTHPASGYAMVGVAAVLSVDDDAITTARVAVNGVTERSTRLEAVEASLVGESSDAETLTAAAERATADLESIPLVSDTHASGEYRVHLLPTYVERALECALERVGEVETAGGEGE